MAELPSGTVTFLFTDVEGSTVRMGVRTGEVGSETMITAAWTSIARRGSARLATVASC
jgi:hypothetical protein